MFLTQRCCQDVGPGLTDTCLRDVLQGCLQTLTLQYMISQSFLGSARLQLPFSKADGIADNARTVFFLDHISTLLEMRFAIHNTILFAQHFVCRQRKQAVYFVLQDTVRIIVNAGITIFYFHRSQA